MTTPTREPRFRHNVDGSIAVQQDGLADRWLLVAGPDYRGPEHVDAHGEGWSEAALIVLPEPAGHLDSEVTPRYFSSEHAAARFPGGKPAMHLDAARDLSPDLAAWTALAGSTCGLLWT